MIWTENKPQPTDIPNLDLPSLITANKIAFRQAIEKHSFWTDSSTNSIGQTRLSDGSFGPGSARAYFDTQSRISASDESTKPLEGRLFVTSDTSRLFGFGAGPVLLGSKNAIVYQTGSQATIAQNNRVLLCSSIQSVVATSSGTSYASVVFPVTYNAAPRVLVTPISSVTVRVSIPSVLTITTSGFSVSFRLFSGTEQAANFYWRSHGTVPITT